ncbi:hypothetical protein [Bacillus siamensis]|uniref:hypothetical protein n=1 Tax=Bacillus siamensis TaxID=659243 RepID=UPI003F67A7FB
MSTDIIVAIINGLVTILVGIITARVAYLGSMRGAKLQIEKANADAERVKKEEEELAKKFKVIPINGNNEKYKKD